MISEELLILRLFNYNYNNDVMCKEICTLCQNQ